MKQGNGKRRNNDDEGQGRLLPAPLLFMKKGKGLEVTGKEGNFAAGLSYSLPPTGDSPYLRGRVKERRDSTECLYSETIPRHGREKSRRDRFYDKQIK